MNQVNNLFDCLYNINEKNSFNIDITAIHSMIKILSGDKNISDYFEKQYSRIHGRKRKKTFLNKMKKYLIERYPYDFYYLEKDSLIDEVSNKKL